MQSWAEGQEMIRLRLAVPAVLAAAAVAGCLTYFVAPTARVEADHPSPPIAPELTVPDAGASTTIDHPPNAEEKAAQAYREAAEAILRRAPNARASAGIDEQPISGHIPLPKRRPATAPDLR